jgi:hypothetical protein
MTHKWQMRQDTVRDGSQQRNVLGNQHMLTTLNDLKVSKVKKISNVLNGSPVQKWLRIL